MKLRKKLAIMAVCLSTAAVSGQEITFNPHWYLQMQAGAAHTVGEAGFKDLISPSAALSAGYQFTSLWGVRAGISGWQAKGAWVSPFSDYKFNYLQGNVDAMLDLSNLFCGYNHKRFFDAYLFVGAGVNGAFGNDEAVALSNAGYAMEYLWKDNKVSIAGRGGLGANLRLSERVYFNLEVNANLLTDKFNSKKAGNADWQFNALAGFTFKLGKTGKKTAPVRYDDTPAQVPVQAPVEVKKAEEPVAAAVVEEKKEVQTLAENIFFAINSAVIRNSEVGKIDNLAAFLQKNSRAKVSICGYADAATGTATINERLSKMRAQAVKKALEAKGIAAERITVDFKGDKEQPFTVVEENRVTICIAE